MGRKNANVRRSNGKRLKHGPKSQINRKRFGSFVLDEVNGEPIPMRTKKLGTMRKRMAT